MTPNHYDRLRTTIQQVFDSFKFGSMMDSNVSVIKIV